MVDFVKSGSEFLVNGQTTGYQDLPSITGLAGGGFVATWMDTSGASGLGVAKARLYNVAGQAIGAEFGISGGAVTEQSFPTVASLAGGGFVVTWTEAGEQTDYKIKAQVYSASGAVVTSAFLVNSQTWALQNGSNLPGVHNPTITGLSGGGFVVTWQDFGGTGGDSSGAGVLAQVYSASGVPAGSAVRINTQTSQDQTQPAVTSLAGGGFVVTWIDNSAVNPLTLLPAAMMKAQLFDAAGAKLGAELAVNAEVLTDQCLPTVTGLSGGGFVVTWQDASPGVGDPDTVIRAQMYDAAGAKLGAVLTVSSLTGGERDFPVVTSLADGGFVVTWQHFVTAEDSDIMAQIFGADGGKVGAEFRINTVTASYQERPVISSLVGGGFVVAWGDSSGTGGDADGTSIKAQLYNYGSYNVIAGTAGIDTLNGTNADDQILGLASNDRLTGLGGSDLLDGGAGSDTMIGGLGDDIYVVDVSGDVVTEAASQGTDTVQTTLASYTLGNNVENLTFANAIAHSGSGNALNNTLIGAGGNDALNGGAGADRMIGGLGNDTYYVDNAADVVTEAAGGGIDTVSAANSWTLAANIERLTLSGSAAINGTGNGDDNILTGNAAVNVLSGLGGNDALNGGAGADTMIGGLGNDSYTVDTAGDVVTELAGEGTDLVTTAVTYTLSANAENMTLSGTAAISGTGNGDGNVLTGNSGANTLTGLGGNDTLNGGAGADTMIGGLGDDSYLIDNVADVVTELVGQGTDLVTASVAYTLAANAENLTLTGSAAISGTGNGDGNVLTGNSGANTLTGLGGNDTLNGGAGADTMVGGLGDDTYVLDSSSDVVTEAVGQGTDTVQTALGSYTLGANVENLTFTNSSPHTGTGNALANTITGNAGSDTLSGGAGADLMIGGLGSDRYTVDDAGDVVSEAVSEGTETVTTSVTWTLSANVENLTLASGSSAINGTGNADANVLTGNTGANLLAGMDGADTLIGGLGNDTLQGGAGVDRLTGGNGNDTLNGGAGADAFVFDTAPSASTNYDTVQDFTSGSDSLIFSKAAFTAFSAIGLLSVDAFWSGAGVNAAHDATDRFIYNTTTGVLWYDRDGTGSTAAVAVATLAGSPALAFGDLQIVA